jgi:hypothetical protein
MLWAMRIAIIWKDRVGWSRWTASPPAERPEYSQTLKKVRTYDGLHWQDMAHVVASDVPKDRPVWPSSASCLTASG